MTSTISGELFTCVTCNVAFNNSDLQRAHYKTDWHRYNLKRKVAEMPTVSAQEFLERVNLLKIQSENEKTKVNEEMFCKLCSKHFSNENSFLNHKQSKKHRDLEETLKSKEKIDDQIQAKIVDDLVVAKSDRAEKKAIQLEQHIKKQDQMIIEDEEIVEEYDETDKNWEDVSINDEDANEFDESKGIPLNDCFFCEHKSNSIDEKCEHMAKCHSFFIPDMDHVSDLEGLVKFLGVKLGVYHVCLWCSTKCYRNLLSVKRHMADKGHQKIKFEGETLLEYVDFYTFDDEDSIDEEDYDVVNYSGFTIDSEENKKLSLYYNVNKELPFDNDYELELPSGVKVGHRSLFRYYKQSFGHRNMEIKKQSNLTVKDKYRAIANGGAYNPTEIQKQRKDLAFFQRWNSKMHAKLGWKANKLQKHLRRQDITF